MGFKDEIEKTKREMQLRSNTKFNKIIEELSKVDVGIQPMSKARIIDLSVDYDELLDLWFDEVMKESDRARKLEEEEHFKNEFSYKEGNLRGYADGLIMATSILSRLEKKAKRRNNI